MSKKSFNIGNTITFYHWDFAHEVTGTITALCPNNMVTVSYDHPTHGHQLLGLHTSAIQLVDNIDKGIIL